jgi:mRNA interferase MazF
VRRNEVWWAELPEPSGRRPVLLLSRTEAYAVRRKVVVAEVTTRLRGAPTEIRLGRAEGLSRPSVVNVENLVTVPKEWLRERAGALSRPKIVQVNEALRFALELP